MSLADAGSDQPIDFDAASPSPNPTCSSCKAVIADQYWAAGPAILCANCRAAVEQGLNPATDVTARTSRFTTAFFLGLGGMLLGSAVWYAVARFANLEVGLIAILLGWLVGKAIFIGSGHRGGRRYQVLAVLLTYLGIGVSYLPFVPDAMNQGLAMLLFNTLRLPVLVVAGGFPGSVISVLIYGFALVQAWRLTQSTTLAISGPYRVGGAGPAPA